MVTVLSYFALQLVVKNDAPKDMKTVERSFLSLSEVRTTAVSCSQSTNGSWYWDRAVEVVEGGAVWWSIRGG